LPYELNIKILSETFSPESLEPVGLERPVCRRGARKEESRGSENQDGEQLCMDDSLGWH